MGNRVVTLLLGVLLTSTSAAAVQTDFGVDVCDGSSSSKNNAYCSCIGKTAYYQNPGGELPVGKVIGVVYKKAGSCRSKNCQILADHEGHYMVVNDGMGQLTQDPRKSTCK